MAVPQDTVLDKRTPPQGGRDLLDLPYGIVFVAKVFQDLLSVRL